MGDLKRMPAKEAAELFIQKHFPTCQGALLAGSVVRGEETETSDLDIIVFNQHLDSAYRESLIEYDWLIEVFVHNLSSYKEYFASDCERARPSLPRMVSEGIVLQDDGIIMAIKNEAKLLLDKGPLEWSEDIVRMKRYFITDSLDDFIGSSNRAEELFIANTLAELVSEFVLRTNGNWIGASKWIVRSLKQYDEQFAEDFITAFDLYYKTSDKQKVIHLVDHVLQPYGGRLFNGFSLGKEI